MEQIPIESYELEVRQFLETCDCLIQKYKPNGTE